LILGPGEMIPTSASQSAPARAVCGRSRDIPMQMSRTTMAGDAGPSPKGRIQKELTMNKTTVADWGEALHALADHELDATAGGAPGYPGLPFGTRINVSPWGLTSPFNLQWELVGATGTLPR
jgi:hypothetical protein